MLAKILSYALDGLTGYAVDVEVDINSGLPGYDMVVLLRPQQKRARKECALQSKTADFNIPQSA